MMPTFVQTAPPLNSTATAQVRKETVELDPDTITKINCQCKNILQEYEEFHDIEVCNLFEH